MISKDDNCLSINSFKSTLENDECQFLLDNKDIYENKDIFKISDDENQSYDDKYINFDKNNYFYHEHMESNHFSKKSIFPMEGFIGAFNQTFKDKKETDEAKDNLINKDDKTTILFIMKDNRQDDLKNQENNITIKLDKKDNNKLFKTIKYSYKIGNKISRRKSGRKQNIKTKIIRNLIQDIIPSWIKCIEPGKNNKLNKNEIINNFKKNKGIKLSEIFKNQINRFNYAKKDIIYIKLEFTLKEVFLCFVREELSQRKTILLNVLNRLGLDIASYDEKIFFNHLDNKNYYIEIKAEDMEETDKLEKAFSEIISDLSD